MSSHDTAAPGWAPESYWPPLPSNEDLLQRVRGAARRESLREGLERGDLAAIDPAILREALSDEERRHLMRVHPHLALGEYLPELEDGDLPEGEVEIARLYLASGIGNTISVRASRRGEMIEFHIVDEFGDQLSVQPAGAAQPLSNAELLEAVKSLEWHGPLAHGPVWSTREFEAEIDFESAADFISGGSETYPAFAELVEADNRQWLEDRLAEVEDEPED